MRIPASLILAAALAFALVGEGGASPAESSGRQPRPGPSANLWVARDGGSCSRSRVATPFAGGRACRSIDAAWDACRPGDTIAIAAGTYGPQRITGDKASPGCTVRGATGTTLGDLTTEADNFALDNVTVDVGEESQAGWRARGDHVRLTNVRVHGPFASVDIGDASYVSWIGGELGTAGQRGGRRVCGRDAEPVQIGDADHILIDGIRFHPQDADPTPNACSTNGFHLELIRIDGNTGFLTLRNSTFESGDRSGTASVFVTKPEGDVDPHDLTFENNVFGTNDAVGTFDVHENVGTCRNLVFAYNTFLTSVGIFQCAAAVGTRWIGNLGPKPAGDCVGSYELNVWQDTGRDSCGSDRWVRGARAQTDRLGLGGKDGFHLEPGSPAIDAAEPAGYCTTRLRGRDHDRGRRPDGRRCDAGADELARR